jgi:antibiotic biosynthesis monooxygenase (ABM) superfamily enzyme
MTDQPIHIAITMRVRRPHVAEFEHALKDFAGRSLAEPGARGIQCLYPPPGSASTEYGILRSFANARDRDSFYGSAFFKSWLARIAPMVEGESTRRQLNGLEAWFRDPKQPMPPRWKMALLTWIAAWPASMFTQVVVALVVGRNLPQVLQAAFVALGLVVILTWFAMPLLVHIASPWLHPKNAQGAQR